MNPCYAVNTDSRSLLLMELFFMDGVFLSQGAVVTQLMTIRKGEHCQENNILSQVFMLATYTIQNCS